MGFIGCLAALPIPVQLLSFSATILVDAASSGICIGSKSIMSSQWEVPQATWIGTISILMVNIATHAVFFINFGITLLTEFSPKTMYLYKNSR